MACKVIFVYWLSKFSNNIIINFIDNLYIRKGNTGYWKIINYTEACFAFSKGLEN